MTEFDNFEDSIQNGLSAAWGQVVIASATVDFDQIVRKTKDVCDWASKSADAALHAETRAKVLDAIAPLHPSQRDAVLTHLERKLPEPQ